MKNQKLKQCINFQKRRRKLIVDPVFSWKPINCVSHYTHAISYNEKQFHTWNYLGRRSSCVHIWWARGFCKTSYTHLKCWEVASLSFSGFLIDKKFLKDIRTKSDIPYPQLLIDISLWILVSNHWLEKQVFNFLVVAD